jgi:hypothetical protein
LPKFESLFDFTKFLLNESFNQNFCRVLWIFAKSKASIG